MDYQEITLDSSVFLPGSLQALIQATPESYSAAVVAIRRAHLCLLEQAEPCPRDAQAILTRLALETDLTESKLSRDVQYMRLKDSALKAQRALQSNATPAESFSSTPLSSGKASVKSAPAFAPATSVRRLSPAEGKEEKIEKKGEAAPFTVADHALAMQLQAEEAETIKTPFWAPPADSRLSSSASTAISSAASSFSSSSSSSSSSSAAPPPTLPGRGAP